MAEANHNRTPSGMDRRTAAGESMRLSLQEEDDYDLAAMGISDGFRPTANPPAGHNRVPSHSSHRERRSTPPPRPSSMTKPRNLDTFALRHDGATGTFNRPTTIASSSGAGSITRSSSMSTDNPFIRPESPYQGPTGPSHPYHMYPQNTRLTRMASIASTSTNARPTHPYGMYPQNTVPESESIHDSTPSSRIPIGFPGHGANYQRRFGPDGEEAADIIGPLGHTEQLPPYTKYPEEAFARKTVPGMPNIAGAGGIGLATRDPEFASREDLNSPLSRQSHRSLTSDSDHQINVAAFTAVSEKPPDKKWKIVAKRKVWGIVPVWVFVMVALIFLGFILILSIVLKIFMHHMPSTPKASAAAPASGTMYTTVTTTYDYQSLSTVPTGIPALPTGTYSLSIATPSVSQQNCLDSASLYSAWSCAIPPDSIDVSVSLIVGGNKTGCYKIKIESTDYGIPTYNYGTQPPFIDSEPILTLVDDNEESQRGPAWYFAAAYDKLVIVPEDALPSPSNYKRNDVNLRDYVKDFSRKNIPQTGDRPWFCRWNNTVLETFIYVNQTSRSGASALAASLTTATSTGSAQGSYRAYLTQSSAGYVAQASKTSTAPLAASSSSSSGNIIPALFPGYPKVVKVEERRIPAGAYLPYCVKMEIQPDGSAIQVEDSNGAPIQLNLNETEPSLLAPPVKRSLPGTEVMERQVVQMCECQWFSL